MDKKEIFENILNRSCSGAYVLLSCLTGEAAGEKALYQDGRLVGSSGSFFPPVLMDEGITAKEALFTFDRETVLFEQVSSGRNLVICGAGYVALALTRLGKMTGFTVTVLDDRLSFADQAKAAGADLVICDSFGNALRKLEEKENTSYVVVTRGHRYDKECLDELVKKKRVYLGMMGSRRRAAAMKEELLREGVSEETIEQLYAPIGLSIGAETPEEIAVSIMAQIIEVLRKEQKSEGFDDELLKEIVSSDGDIPAILATIIRKKGSAPRQIGTKMLIQKNGNCSGTIGGGCMEAEVISRARTLLSTDRRTEIIEVRMLPEEAGEEGMVCGGTQEVFLERLD